MPVFEKGDMFDVWGKTDIFLFTSNPIVNKSGKAVMGRGIAKQLADKYPHIRRDFANMLGVLNSRFGNVNCDFIGYYDSQPVGFFMVKNHWANNASLEIIDRSVIDLISFLEEEEIGRADLNFPGIGNGKLKREDVLPLLKRLPDTVHIWEYE